MSFSSNDGSFFIFLNRCPRYFSRYRGLEKSKTDLVLNRGSSVSVDISGFLGSREEYYVFIEIKKSS